MRAILGLAAVTFVLLCTTAERPVVAGDADDVGVRLERFGKAWPQDRPPHRVAGDESWKRYAITLRDVVAAGAKGVPALVAGLSDPNPNIRALAARALGFLEAEEAVPQLALLLKDPLNQVAVPAADALGQIGGPTALDALKLAGKDASDVDTSLHIQRAIERGVTLERDAREQLLATDERTLGSAQVGKAAPDFTLSDSGGTPWTLSAQRGKVVVLVFLYGDG